jgi:hypothetical protein
MMAVELIPFHDPFVCLLESNSGGQGQADKDSPCASRPPRRANADGPIWQKVSLRVCFHARISENKREGNLEEHILLMRDGGVMVRCPRRGQCLVFESFLFILRKTFYSLVKLAWLLSLPCSVF